MNWGQVLELSHVLCFSQKWDAESTEPTNKIKQGSNPLVELPLVPFHPRGPNLQLPIASTMKEAKQFWRPMLKPEREVLEKQLAQIKTPPTHAVVLLSVSHDCSFTLKCSTVPAFPDVTAHLTGLRIPRFWNGSHNSWEITRFITARVESPTVTNRKQWSSEERLIADFLLNWRAWLEFRDWDSQPDIHVCTCVFTLLLESKYQPSLLP